MNKIAGHRVNTQTSLKYLYTSNKQYKTKIKNNNSTHNNCNNGYI